MKLFQIINLATSQLAKHLTLVFTGNVFAAGLGFLSVIMVSRELTVSDFGLFTMAISFMRIASQLSGFGMDSAMIRFASSYLEAKKNAEADQVIRYTFLARFIISTILAVILFSTSELLSTNIFHTSDLTPLLKLAAFGVLTISILNYLRSALYTYQLFQTGVIVQTLVDFGKLSTVLMLIFYLKINCFTAVAIFAFAPLPGLVLGFRRLRFELSSKGKPLPRIFSRLFSYTKWLFVSNVCGIMFPYIGIFLLTKMLNSEAAGIYGLALNLTYIFPIIIYSLGSVLLPKVSRFRDKSQFDRYIKGSLKVSLCLGLATIPFLFYSQKIILFFFGTRYLDSVPIFNWLLLSYIVLIFNTTIRMTLHSMNKPHILAIVDLIKLILIVSGCYFLIPTLGALAPAVLTLIVNVSTLGFLSAYVFKLIRSNDIIFQDE